MSRGTELNAESRADLPVSEPCTSSLEAHRGSGGQSTATDYPFRLLQLHMAPLKSRRPSEHYPDVDVDVHKLLLFLPRKQDEIRRSIHDDVLFVEFGLFCSFVLSRPCVFGMFVSYLISPAIPFHDSETRHTYCWAYINTSVPRDSPSVSPSFPQKHYPPLACIYPPSVALLPWLKARPGLIPSSAPSTKCPSTRPMTMPFLRMSSSRPRRH